MQKILVFLFCLIAGLPLFSEKRAFSIADLFCIKGISDPQIAPDGSQIAFVVTEYNLEKGKRNSDIWLVDSDGSSLRQLTRSPKSDSHPRWSPDGKWLTLTRRSVGEPTALYRMSSRGRDIRRLEFLNQKIEDEVDIRPAEELWVEGANGKPVHVFIVKPYGFDPEKKYPLILNVHGGPQSQWADAFRGDWQVYPGAGYIVAFPNPHGSTGYGQAYTAAISKDWGGKSV